MTGPIDIHPEVARLHDEGRDVGEIAHELGMSRYAVRRMVDHLDPPAARPAAPLIPPREAYLPNQATRGHGSRHSRMALHDAGIGVAKRKPDIPNPWSDTR